MLFDFICLKNSPTLINDLIIIITIIIIPVIIAVIIISALKDLKKCSISNYLPYRFKPTLNNSQFINAMH